MKQFKVYKWNVTLLHDRNHFITADMNFLLCTLAVHGVICSVTIAIQEDNGLLQETSTH